MSESDKLMAFGTWLTTRKLQLEAELYSLSLNTKLPVGTIRIKAGHLEATRHVLEAFTELYKSDLGKFRREYLGQDPGDDKESTEDGPS